jgi:UDP-N-acetylmuramoylalanine--D-glutamate ligase
MGREVVIFDDRDRSAEPEIGELLAAGARAVWGELDSAQAARRLEGLDALIVSPGVGPEHPLLAAAAELGVKLAPELELAWLATGKAKTVAITGTNGKTTVTMFVRHILESAGVRAIQTGNIGHAFSEAVVEAGDGRDATTFVVEASSFQLERIEHFAPDVAILLNVTPDHLDRHRTFEAYAAAKARIGEMQSPEQTLVINQDDPECLRVAARSPGRKLFYSIERPVERGAWLDDDRLVLATAPDRAQRLIDLEELPLFGLHNAANALAAACAASALGVGRKAIAAALKTFEGAPHRLQTIATIDGVAYINDSKATNVDAMIKALSSFQAPIHLIAGGLDKAGPFALALPHMEGRVARAYLIGKAADTIEAAWRGNVEMIPCGTLDRALEHASTRARDGEIVLLAPGCASFDQFKHFAHRGEVFAEWVRRREAARTGADAADRHGGWSEG